MAQVALYEFGAFCGTPHLCKTFWEPRAIETHGTHGVGLQEQVEQLETGQWLERLERSACPARVRLLGQGIIWSKVLLRFSTTDPVQLLVFVLLHFRQPVYTEQCVVRCCNYFCNAGVLSYFSPNINGLAGVADRS